MSGAPRGDRRGSFHSSDDAEPRYRALLEAARATWWSSENFDKWKAHYIDEYDRGHFIRGLIGRYAPDLSLRGARILDVGSGDGGVLIALAEAGAIGQGLEPNEGSVTRARVRAEEHGVEVAFRTGVAEDLPFSAGAFDLVLIDNVLEHVQDRERSLAEIHRVLRPGGLLYLVTPKPFALHSLLSDPHYGMAGLVLLPRPVQKWYFEVVRGGGRGQYGVGWIPTRRWLRRRLARQGFEMLVSPRELWIRYVEEKLRSTRELSTPWKERLGASLAGRPALLGNPALRWLLDVAIGSNLFLVRRT